MTNDYIRREDAVDVFNRAVQDVGILDADDIETVFGMLSSADVVSKADLKTLLEETEKELVKDTDKYSIAYNFIVAVIGIIKCKIMHMGERKE